MLKETDIQQVRNINKVLYDVDIVPMYGGLLCQHPYYTGMMTVDRDGSLLDLNNPEHKSRAREYIFEMIDNSSIVTLYMLIQSAYKLLWVSLCKDFLSEKDFAEYLADAWVTQENPNMDVNVTRRSSISMFRKANKQYLMTPEDYEYYMNLPEEITIWRGVSLGRVKLGLSWTDDYDKAVWFQHRFENTSDKKRGRLYQVTTPKSNILAYLNTRGEAELVTNVFKVQKDIVEVSL